MFKSSIQVLNRRTFTYTLVKTFLPSVDHCRNKSDIRETFFKNEHKQQLFGGF